MGTKTETETAKVEVTVEARPEGRVAWVTVDRRRKLNALTTAIMAQLAEAFRELGRDDDLRMAVLTGAGERSFIGGANLDEVAALNQETARAFITRVHLVCRAIRDLPVPVLARVNGYCLGAGLEIAASCDGRIAADHAIFSMPETRVGLPSVVEAALLPRLVGWGKAREIVLLARNYSAAEALAMGLVEEVATAGQLDACTGRWIDDLLAAGPRAVRLQKALIAEWERRPLDEAIQAGIESLVAAFATDEPQRMIAPFFERRRSS